MAGCHIEISKKNCSGLYVAVNYSATVTASGNTFIGPDCDSAIVEEMSSRFKLGPPRNMQEMKNSFGLWSKPVIDRNNQIFVSKKGGSKISDSTSDFLSPKTPTLEELAARDIQRRLTTHPIHSKDACTSDYALARTSRCVCHDLNKKPLFYAVGNTFGYDLSMGQNLGAEEPNEGLTIRILLGACGDIRNLLKTVSSLQPPLSPVGTVQIRVQVMLNDQNVAILARNVLLLYLISDRTSVIDVVAIWANHALTSAQRKLLDKALMTLAESLPGWLVLPADPSCNLGVDLMEAFAAWRDCTMSLKELLNLRYESVTSNTAVLESAVKLVENAVGHNRFEKQIRRHITSGNVGNTTKEFQSANPTLLEAPSLQYLLYWSSSIYRAVKLDVSSSTHSNVELSELLLQAIRPQIEVVSESFERGSLEVAVIAGDVLEGMLFGGFLRLLRQMNGHDRQSSSSLFDFIDLTNVADYVSMPAVVQAAVPLLKVVKHATIHAQSMQWCGPSMGFNIKEPLAFLRTAIGMDLETYQELLGLTVQAQVVGSSKNLVLQTQWKWELSAASTETWLTGAMVLLETMSAAKLHCTSNRVECITNGKIGGAAHKLVSGTLAGLENSSPLTMLHLLFLRCPGILMPIVRVLVGTYESAYNIRKWELMGHAMFQLDPVLSLTTFVKATFQANVHFYSLLACDEMPLCLTVSKVPLPLLDVASSDVLQVLDAIAYESECDRVEVMLQRALTENPKCSSYYLTLCVVAHGTTLQAVGHSVPWSFTTQPLTQELGSPLLPIWTARHCLSEQPLLSDDLDLIELIAKRQCNRGKDTLVQSSWTTHKVLDTQKYLVVQILLPTPFPGVDEAAIAIAISSSGTSLTITTKSVVKKKSSARKHASSVSGFPEKHVITLPIAVASDGHNTKVSRNLGIMIVRLPKLNPP